MTVDIFKTTDRIDKLNKTLQPVKMNVPIYQKDTIDILTPCFIVDTDLAYFTANYLYCSDLSRYYYFSRPAVLLTGGHMAIYCQIDLLKTYGNSIKNCNATILRQSKPTDFTDQKFPLSHESWCECRVLDSNLTNNGNLHYVIGVNSSYN